MKILPFLRSPIFAVAAFRAYRHLGVKFFQSLRLTHLTILNNLHQ